MTDSPSFFDTLQVPVSPALDPEHLKSQYLQLSADAHPDRAAKEGISREKAEHLSSRINQAYQALDHMPSRLRHFIGLQAGKEPGSLKQVPEAIGDRFMRVCQVIRETDAVLKEKPSEEASELAMVMFLKQSMPLRTSLTSMIQSLDQSVADMEHRLQTMTKDWEQTDASGELHPDWTALYHEWTFVDRWRKQLSDRLLELTL